MNEETKIMIACEIAESIMATMHQAKIIVGIDGNPHDPTGYTNTGRWWFEHIYNKVRYELEEAEL